MYNPYNCNADKDDDNNYLWAREDASGNQLTCDKFESATFDDDGMQDSYSYDATYALAYAVHDLVMQQNKTSLVPSELLMMLQQVRAHAPRPPCAHVCAFVRPVCVSRCIAAAAGVPTLPAARASPRGRCNSRARRARCCSWLASARA
eukprot:6813421-Prymnesium_polylepis.1